jgi:hypothetical protein
MSRESAELSDKLRLASDRLMVLLDELVELETAKRSMQPGSGDFVELAKRIERLAQAALLQTQRQGDLAEATREAVGTSAEMAATIEETPPRPMEMILGEWRAAERRLQSVDAGSQEWAVVETEVRRLRDEYRRAQLVSRSDPPSD